MAQAAAATITDATAAPADAKLLDGDSLEGIFGIAIDTEPTPLPRSAVRAVPAKTATKPKAMGNTAKPRSRVANDPFASLVTAARADIRAALGRGGR